MSCRQRHRQALLLAALWLTAAGRAAPAEQPPTRQAGLAELARLETLVAAREGSGKYGTHKGKQLPLDHAAKLLAAIREARATLTAATGADVGELAAGAMSRGLVAWQFPPLIHITGDALPPTLADPRGVRIDAVQDEIAIGGFYLTNLTGKPLVVELKPAKPLTGLSVQWVTTHEDVRIEEFRGRTPTHISRIVPLVRGIYLPLEPGMTRQVWIEVRTHELAPGAHAAELALRVGSAEWLTPKERQTWLPGPPPEARLGGQLGPAAGEKKAPDDDAGGLDGLEQDFVDDLQRRDYPRYDRRIALHVEVAPVRLPAVPRFGVYTWNASAAGSPAYIKALVEHKTNLFALMEPTFIIANGELTLDPDRVRGLRRLIAAVKPHGKFISLYGFVQSFTKAMAEEHTIKFMSDDYQRYLASYFRQYIAALEDAGLDYEDYALELWDEPRNMKMFRDLQQVCKLLHGIDPKVRFMIDPLCKLQDGYELVAEHIAMWIPHHGMVYDIRPPMPLPEWVAGGKDPAEFGRDNNQSIQWSLHRQRRQRGAYLMTYSQYGSASNLDPVGVFRHWPWKMWWMQFDGISFWKVWHATNGMVPGLGINKTLKGWREGVEDVQLVYLLEDAIAAMQAAGADPAEIARARAVRQKVQQLCIKDMGWWCMDPFRGHANFAAARAALVAELTRLQAVKAR